MGSGMPAFDTIVLPFSEPDAIMRSDCVIMGREGLLTRFRDLAIPVDGRFALKNEACALQLAHANNKLLSLSNSRTRILAHQVESTHRIVNSLNHRYMLADEVGLGKTVEAGLVIKELIYRYDYERILIVAPASLLIQWQQEMESKFNERFVIVDRRCLCGTRSAGERGTNPWKKHRRVICSLDFIKNRGFYTDLKKARWDAVIIDEAHRLRRDSMKSTLAYNVAEILAETTKALLLLTATPFRGRLEELYYLVRLVDRNLLGPFQSFYNDFCLESSDLAPLRSSVSQVLIRRTKKEVGGFTRRYAGTVRFELYPEERELYDATTRYVVEEFNRSQQTENRAVGFVMTVFQKLLDSSSFALETALCNRRKNLNIRLEKGAVCEQEGELWEAGEAPACGTDDIEDACGVVSCAGGKNTAELEAEIATIKHLIELAGKITRNKKGEKLRMLLKKLKREGNSKFLVFTQFKTTQTYLTGLLGDFKVEVFNGSMDKEQKEKSIMMFREEAEILISTEAGGEGRNLQFCNILINYDLPWSPLKIEQRIGRVHRFGQPSDVFIYNFSTKNTVAERVLEVLTHKLRLFEESIGVPDVMLGQVEDEVNLTSLFMEMAVGRQSKRSVMMRLDQDIEKARRSYEKLNELTVTQRIDFNYDEYYRITLREREFTNRRIELFINRLRHEDDTVKNLLNDRDPETGFYRINHFGGIGPSTGTYGTFDSARALENESIDFLAFGHPLVDHLFEYCRGDGFGGLTGMRKIEYRRPFTGVVFNFLVVFTAGGSSVSELIPVVLDPRETAGIDTLEEIERCCVLQEGLPHSPTDRQLRLIRAIQRRADDLFSRAEMKILEKVRRKVSEQEDSMRIAVDPEMEKITLSFGKKLKELGEQLERQECQSKWFGKNMKSAISKTRNEMAHVERERELLLASYGRRKSITTVITFLTAGILIAGPSSGD